MSDTTPEDRPRSRYALAAILLVMGGLHFVLPKPFMRIVPPMFGAPRFWTYASGVAELVSGGLLLSTKTKHIGAWVSAATIVAVYPANIWMAMDAGAPNNPEAVAAWVRLPFQIPLVLWALSHRRRITHVTLTSEQHLADAIDEAGGYPALAQRVADEEPELR